MTYNSRGGVVDEAALVRALADRRIAGATRETRQAMADRVFDNLHGFFADGRLISAAPAA